MTSVMYKPLVEAQYLDGKGGGTSSNLATNLPNLVGVKIAVVSFPPMRRASVNQSIGEYEGVDAFIILNELFAKISIQPLN